MLEETEKALNKFARDVVRGAKRNARKKSASGDLEGSIGSDVDVGPNSFSLSFYMTEYGAFVDQGVSGKRRKFNTPFSFSNKRPPMSSINKWIKQKGIQGRDKKGKFITHKSLAFLISRSIFEKGIRPSLFFTKPFEKEFNKLPDFVLHRFSLDVDALLEQSLNAID